MAKLASSLRAIAVVVLIGSGLLRAQQCDSGVTFSGPIQIGKGGTYTGNWQSTDSSVPAVSIYTTEPVTIINSRLKGPGDLMLSGTGSVLTVQQSCFVGVNPNVAGQEKGTPIHTYQAASVLVENCDFESGGSQGVWVQQYDGNYSLSNTIKILNNRIHNVDGRLSDGAGGYLTTLASQNSSQQSHAIAFSNVVGVPGIEIAWNQIINEPYQSGLGDGINIWESSGTPAYPMQVHDNYIQGDFDSVPSADANALPYDGSGLTTDGSAQTDPTLTTSFLKIHDNQAVSMGNVGISIAIGHDLEMYSNRVVSSGQLSDGTNITTAYAAGTMHWDWRYPPPATPPGNFGNNSVHDNLSGLRRMRNGIWERSDYYIPVPPAVSFNNVSWTPSTADAPTLTDEANELLLWNEKLLRQGITVGSPLVVPALNGAILVVSGNNQVGAPNSALPAPVVVRVVDLKGTAAPGVNVAFMVATTNATARTLFAVSDANGLASTEIVLGTAPAGVLVNVIAVGYTGASFSLWVTQPAASVLPSAANPVAGSRTSQTFTFTFSDSGGFQNLTVIDVLFNDVLDGRQACYVAFVPSRASSGSVYLVDNAGDAGGPYSGMVLPSSGSVSNSQCTIGGTGSSVSGSGNTLTLTLAITFTQSFAGNKVLYMSAQDASSNSGWYVLGTWNVPGSTPAGPWVGGMTPASSNSLTQTYTFTFTDTNGWQDISLANVLIDNAINGIGACYVAFVPSADAAGSLFLVDDAGDAGGPYSGMVLPSSGSVSNSQCTISGTGSSVSGSGNTLTLTLAITFTQSFAGNKVFYLAARSNTLNSGWQAVGTVTVP